MENYKDVDELDMLIDIKLNNRDEIIFSNVDEAIAYLLDLANNN